MGARRRGAAVRRSARAAPEAAGWRVTLNFRDGRFASAAAAPPPPVTPPSPLVGNTLDLLARCTVIAAPIVWLGGLLAGVVERRRGSRFAEVALASAIAATVAWIVRPGGFTTERGHVGVALGLIAMLIAVRVLRWLRRVERSRRLHFCYTCGYDLTGNVSGACPECGTITEAGVARQQAERAVIAADAVAQTVVDEDEAVEGGEEVPDTLPLDVSETEPAPQR
jgi:hypothetical protein